LFLIVKFKVTTESQPATFVVVNVGVFVEAVYVTPFQVYEVQAAIVSTPVLAQLSPIKNDPKVVTPETAVLVDVAEVNVGKDHPLLYFPTLKLVATALFKIFPEAKPKFTE
jgi:hypothetical protein